MLDKDQIQRFIIRDTAIRGQFVSLDDSFIEVIKRTQAQGRTAQILGEALAAISLLAATIKMKGKITLQITGDGDANLLVAQATSNHSLRGLIRGTIADDDSRDLNQIFNSDHLVISIETGDDKPHQGIVPLQSGNIAGALKAYFQHSEQLPTQLWLVANERGASGLLLQQMPETKHTKQKADDWDRVQILADTLKDEELLELSSVEILHRLFNQDDVQLFDAENIQFDCSCSQKRSESILLNVGQSEVESILEDRDDIEIVCEFCNQAYVFDRIDIASIFSSNQTPLSSDTEIKH